MMISAETIYMVAQENEDRQKYLVGKIDERDEKISELSKEKEKLLDFIERLSRNGAIDWTFRNFTKEAREILEKAGR